MSGVPASPGSYIQQLVMQVSSVSGTPTYAKLGLQEGFLLSIGAIAGATPQRGNVYVRIWLQKAAIVGTTLSASMPLVADYASLYHAVGWPGGRVLFPTEGPGYLYEYTLSNPGAGLDWSYAIAVNSRVRIQSINAQLLTSATVANRIVRVQVKNQLSGVAYQAAANQTIAANTTAQVSISPANATSITDTATVNIAIPSPLFLYGNEFIGVSTPNLQSGDQWSAIHFLMEVWVDGI